MHVNQSINHKAEFGDWIGRIRKRPVHVITTNFRPVPLSHHLFAGSELFKILDAKSACSACVGLLPFLCVLYYT